MKSLFIGTPTIAHMTIRSLPCLAHAAGASVVACQIWNKPGTGLARASIKWDRKRDPDFLIWRHFLGRKPVSTFPENALRLAAPSACRHNNNSRGKE
jgi:hypothetical protein